VEITQFHNKYCGDYTEEVFEMAINQLKQKGDIQENPSGYISLL
jgi:hypothetical protein